ncbi:MAG: ABC transporter permease [Bacteroidetes bacterium]|jgi:lipoprotein-releasing system permease protein|nr:ABC transporter permease [Bacteroidota bacterium]MBK7504217.1 ABC transporter permease [Bacteroidota bacterium]
MNFPLEVAKRYLRSKKSTHAINYISRVTGLAMFFGTAALVIILSVFNGFESLVISLYNVFYPDISIEASFGKTFSISDEKFNKIKSTDGVYAVSKTITENAIVSYAEKQEIATLKGVDANYYKVNKTFKDCIGVGESTLTDKKGSSFAIVGAGIAINLGIDVNAYLNNLTVYMPRRNTAYLNAFQNSFNRASIFPIGIFSFQQEFDNKYIVVPIEFMENLLGSTTQISNIEIAIKDGYKSKQVMADIEKILGKGFILKPRLEQNKTLYKIMRTEKWVVFALLTFVILINAFNIIGALSMLVIEKKQDISTLISLGATPKTILFIFLFEGSLLSVGGAFIGMLFAIIICVLQKVFGIIPMPGESFLIKSFPVEMRMMDFVSVFFIIVVISLVASYIPAKKAAKQKISFGN